MQKFKIHIFRPNDNLKALVRKLKQVDGVDGFLGDYAFTADHGGRATAIEIADTAKQIFLVDMAVNYPEFFKALGFKRRVADSLVDELWDYLEFDNDGHMNTLWRFSGKRFKESVDEFDFIDLGSLNTIVE